MKKFSILEIIIIFSCIFSSTILYFSIYVYTQQKEDREDKKSLMYWKGLIKKAEILSSPDDIQIKKLLKILDEQDYDRKKYNYEEIKKDVNVYYNFIKSEQYSLIDYDLKIWVIKKLSQKHSMKITNKLKEEYKKDAIVYEDEQVRSLIREELSKLIKKDELKKLDKYIDERMRNNGWRWKRKGYGIVRTGN